VLRAGGLDPDATKLITVEELTERPIIRQNPD
jgi:hypothetical protein